MFGDNKVIQYFVLKTIHLVQTWIKISKFLSQNKPFWARTLIVITIINLLQFMTTLDTLSNTTVSPLVWGVNLRTL